MQDFKKLLIWTKGMEIVDLIFEVSKSLPPEERYALSSQMKRSAVSIPSNIAEGSSKTSQKDFNRYLEISLGSAFELETQLLIIKKHYPKCTELVDKCLHTLDE